MWGWSKHKQEKIVKKIRQCTDWRYRFGDALISRPYMDLQNIPYAEKLFKQILGLWNGRDVLIVEGEQTRLGVGNDLFDCCRSVKRILAPPVGAFEAYERIMAAVVEHHKGELVILALGPTATVLAADLADRNIQALDIGHIDIEYEWFLNCATTKEAVKGKFTNENADGRNFTECNDAKYLSQIITRVN
jgi:glycosyltransferase family protein